MRLGLKKRPKREGILIPSPAKSKTSATAHSRDAPPRLAFALDAVESSRSFVTVALQLAPCLIASIEGRFTFNFVLEQRAILEARRLIHIHNATFGDVSAISPTGAYCNLVIINVYTFSMHSYSYRAA
ncbi:unnamed protein product [Cyclocybe aegerita]|uniref:Uncharacterized protein n=1 Tax=Cyclocybe aegerita TaxID=1973307 RepID=A0A8S0VVK6_CYCAE|nr:unnamed protein product [Cyclocybe aegerita]